MEWELPTLPADQWSPVTGVQDWKELIREKTLPLESRTSVKIYVSHANDAFVNPLLIQGKVPRTSDEHAAHDSGETAHVPPATDPVHAPSSVHTGTKDATMEVSPAPGTGTQLPQTQLDPKPSVPVPPNQPDSEPIVPPVQTPPVAKSSAPSAAHTRGPPDTTQSLSPLPV